MKVTTPTIIATSLLSGLSASAPTQAPTYPAHQLSLNFRLVANVTSGDFTPSIKNHYVSGYHTGAGTSIAILNPTTGLTFYENGTSGTQKYDGETYIATDLGTPAYPYGLSISPPAALPNSTGRAVLINVGTGTENIGITEFPNPWAELYYNSEYRSSVFYACNTTLVIYGPDPQFVLYQRFDNETTPEGCAELKIYPECVGNVSTVAANAYEASCYPSVAEID